MSNGSEKSLEEELKELLTPALLKLLTLRDGAARLLDELPKAFPPEAVAGFPSHDWRAWEAVGLFYKNQGRHYEALAIFSALYDQMLRAQTTVDKRTHKSVPLVWMSDCYWEMGCPVHAKRYLMLTLCEDAISEKGKVSPGTTGVYFRIVWRQGLTHDQFESYSQKAFELFSAAREWGVFPESLLQDFDHNWMAEIPAPQEAAFYAVNRSYVKHLLGGLGEPTGRVLERLAEYVLSCMPGCRTRRRQRSASTDYDVVCSMEGFEVDFRSEFGRYFVCECKDWQSPADFTTFAKFCRVLDSTKSRFGILFSKVGLSGAGNTRDAEREQLKVFQDRGLVIVVVDENDLLRVSEGVNFTSILRSKYERVRLDLTHSSEVTPGKK